MKGQIGTARYQALLHYVSCDDDDESCSRDYCTLHFTNKELRSRDYQWPLGELLIDQL